MSEYLELVRDGEESSISCGDNREMAQATKALLVRIDLLKKSTSEESAIKELAEMKELIDVMDYLVDRKISRRQVELRKDFGGYDQFKLR